MAMQTKTIKQKMNSVQNIGKITKAMEMISVSKMKRSVEKRAASEVFAERSFELLETLASHKNLSHPFLEEQEGDRVLMVIIASNKGLCGGYNINVSKQVTAFIKKNPATSIDAIVIGKQAERIAKRNHLDVVASFTEFSDYYTASEVRSLYHSITETYENNHSYREVLIAYTNFVSSLQFEPQVRPFIPISVPETKQSLELETANDQKHFAPYSFEPSEQEVLNKVVPAVLVTVLYQFLLESLASEHSSRVVAMRNASDNAKDLLDELNLNYNRARQAAITQEIAEIVGGSSAMS